MKQNEIAIYLKLKKQSQHESAIKSILNTNIFKMLLDTGTILKVAKGRGAIYSIVKGKEFDQFFSNHYTEIEDSEPSRITNAVKYNNSKIRSKGEQIVFLRGFALADVNYESIDLDFHTKKFGVFATQLKNLKTRKLCYVENLKCFLIAEKLLGSDFVFIHPYGRPSKELIQKLKVEQFLFFPDYDYTGLNDYLRCKKTLALTDLYVPDNYEAVLKQKAKAQIKDGQKIPKEVLTSEDEKVKNISKLLQKSNLFLEQEVLFYER